MLQEFVLNMFYNKFSLIYSLYKVIFVLNAAQVDFGSDQISNAQITACVPAKYCHVLYSLQYRLYVCSACSISGSK